MLRRGDEQTIQDTLAESLSFTARDLLDNDLDTLMLRVHTVKLDQIQNTSAFKIQSWYRMATKRKKFLELKKNARIIQRIWRSHKMFKIFRDIKKIKQRQGALLI